MKDQYFGDAGDYGKYGLLRFIAEKGIKIGVHWYLTDSDDSNDGKHTAYLSDKKMKEFDPELHQTLGEMVAKKETRKTSVFEDKKMIPNAIYFHEIVPQNINGKRNEWHKKAFEFFRDRELVFMDPDNGLLGKQRRHKDKFCFPNEVADFYKDGKDVVYYCSKGRRSNKDWNDYKNVMKKEYLPDAEILVITYHKGTQRSYVFVLHPKSKGRYVEILGDFLQVWEGIFTKETA